MNQFGPYHDEFSLMRQFTSGERAAFTSVYKAYHLRVYRYAQQFLPTDADAEDITADSFVKLWNRRAEFNNLEHIRAFLHTTVRNGCTDFLRHEKVVSEKHGLLLQQLQEGQERQFELQELRAELLQLVYAEVEKMPAKMKEIFLLSYKQGLKPAEIAQLLGISVQTVSNQKVNAINLLKISLGNSPLLLALLLCLESPQYWTA